MLTWFLFSLLIMHIHTMPYKKVHVIAFVVCLFLASSALVFVYLVFLLKSFTLAETFS